MQARTAWLHASKGGTELAEVWSCGAVASSLAGFTGRYPLPSGAPLPESGAAGWTGPRRSGGPAGPPYRESAGQSREKGRVSRVREKKIITVKALR